MAKMKAFDDNFVKNLALFMVQHNMQEECTKYHVTPNTVYSIVNRRQSKVASATYNKIVAMLNGDQPQQDKVKLKTTEPIKSETVAEEITPPKSTEVITVPKEVLDDIKYLKECFKQLKNLVELNKLLTGSLSDRVNSATQGLDESARRGLRNFDLQSQEFSKRMDSLDKNFDVMDKRQAYTTKEIQNIKEDVKSLKIHLNPTKFK